jgi:hypothetical protein
MLTYAFDLLHAIYEEEGYEPAEIPEKILTHNLYGIEIDERAGELAAFALTMKARAKQRRFFSKGVRPNICVLQNVHFDAGELKNYMDFVGRDLFTAPLQSTLRQFEEADNFGSLIRPDVTDVTDILQILEAKDVSGELLLYPTQQKVLQALRQADFLSPKYHVVIANPPYMGGKGMNGRLGAWAKDNYPNSKSDLFAMFIERNLDLVRKRGAVAMITMQSWMFQTSYEAFRDELLSRNVLLSLAHFGPRAFDSIGGEVVSTVAFVIESSSGSEYLGDYIRVVDGNSEQEKQLALIEAIRDPACGWRFRVSASEFNKIPGCPIAYWANSFSIFSENRKLSDVSDLKVGLQTGDNDRFLRLWHEIRKDNFKRFNDSSDKWYPYSKGGEFRKWYGNNDYVIDWHDDGDQIKNFRDDDGRLRSRPQNIGYYFKEAVEWSDIGQVKLGVRLRGSSSHFDVVAMSLFARNGSSPFEYLAYMNSTVANYFAQIVITGMHTNTGYVGKLPYKEIKNNSTHQSQECLKFARKDWDSYETSWDFTSLPLLNPDYHQPTLKATYQTLRAHWQEMTLEMQRLEEENNRIFIEAYGLHDELTPEVPLSEITLTCNPHYRYGGDKSEDVLEALLLADTMRELVSYAVGCMFGRYALEKPGLILANQGETIDDYLKQIPEPSFPADDDNVIPMLDGDWFTDDIAERFRKFLRVAFGEEHYEANLKFIEEALGKDIRKYFLKDFYNDQVRRYKKRPIYWLYSSPKGTFNALIYMHRYRPDTVSVVLNDYLREFRTKLSARKSHLEGVSISANAGQGEKTKALKEIESLKKMIVELETWEREVMYPLATQQKEIDLDNGVKKNYVMFGSALKQIPGLDATED